VGERRAFGKPVGSFQNTKFRLAEAHTEVQVTQAYVDRCVLALNAGTLTGAEAATVKWWATEMYKRVVDGCLQLFGGYGYMVEYPIARAYADARITTIYGGTTEIMKTIVAKSLGL
jgi:long-chain-acyl-CoA dehydrogenase